MAVERMTVPDGPSAQGPYSQVVRAGDFLYVSGQGPIDPSTNEFSFGDIRHETKLVLQNIQKILAGCSASMADVVRCSVYLAEASDFGAMNEVYACFFASAPPARTTVQATLVDPGMKIEVDCVAYVPSSPKADWR
jgi:2-iminobutanoate/2-iminopropanoate deaminase